MAKFISGGWTPIDRVRDKFKTLPLHDILKLPMADVHDKATRSYNMSRIKDKNTQPEMIVRKFLFANGFRYRLHDKNLSGKPDIVLPKYKTVIFINGCFWHGHEGCKHAFLPQTRREWWLEKIGKNIVNDKKAIKSLQETGWNIITIWGCELKPKNYQNRLSQLKELIFSFNQVD